MGDQGGTLAKTSSRYSAKLTSAEKCIFWSYYYTNLESHDFEGPVERATSSEAYDTH